MGARESNELTKSFEDGIRFQNLLLHPGAHVAGHRAQVLQYEFGRLRLAGSAFARYNARLVRVQGLQTGVRSLGQREDVRFQRAHFGATILEYMVLQQMVREDG